MERAAVERVIRDAYAARRDEAVNERPGDHGRTIRGHDVLRAFLEQLFSTWDGRAFEMDQIVIDVAADLARAAVYTTERMRHSPSGRAFDFEALDLLSFREGRIASLLESFDTDLLAQFAGASSVQVNAPG
jgi:ketosteroid isomerase-like protein